MNEPSTPPITGIGRLPHAHCLAWTSEKPTQAGYYWYRDEAGSRVVLVRAPWPELSETYLAYWPVKGTAAENSPVQSLHGDWHGPLNEPDAEALPPGTGLHGAISQWMTHHHLKWTCEMLPGGAGACITWEPNAAAQPALTTTSTPE